MRTSESFEEHKTNVIGKCCKSWMVLSAKTLLGYEYMITPHLCKSGYCNICRPRKLLLLRKRLFDTLQGERWRLITLTFKDHATDKTDQFVRAHGMLKKTIQRLRRRWPDLKYARTFEVHKSGFPHVHLITNKYIPVKFLSETWKELGGGLVEIREPRCTICGGTLPCVEHKQKKYASYKQAARYLTEEMDSGKKYQDPYRLGVEFWKANVRSLMTSRNLPLAPDKKEKAWYYLRGAQDLKTAMEEYEKLMFEYLYMDGVKPSIDFGKNRIKIGYGFKDSPAVKLDFRTKIERPEGWMP